MKNRLRCGVCAVAVTCVLMGVCRGQDAPATPSSSSQQVPAATPAPAQYQVVRDSYRGPFSTVGIAVKVSTLGAGMDLAMPMSRHLNLRVGASFLSYGPTFNVDGIDYGANLRFNAGQVNVDWFPMAGGFHISPGVMFFKNDVTATANVSGGSTFTLNDQTYTSSPTDPARGNAALTFPHTAAPSLMMGWGNIVPRGPKHWSVPFEFGVAYVGATTVNVNLAGTVCTTQQGVTGCFNAATDPQTQANLKAEIVTLNEDLKRVEVYPLLSLGLSYKF